MILCVAGVARIYVKCCVLVGVAGVAKICVKKISVGARARARCGKNNVCVAGLAIRHGVSVSVLAQWAISFQKGAWLCLEIWDDFDTGSKK